MILDKGKIYKDGRIEITDGLILTIPKIGDIFEVGEKSYFSLVTTMCSNAFDYKWQLYEQGLDFTKIEDYDMFLAFIVPTLKKEETKILFGDEVDFANMKIMDDETTGKKKLVQILKDDVLVFDIATYQILMTYLRMIHNLKRSYDTYMNNAVKMAEIEDAKMYYEDHKYDEYKPYLFNLVSAMINNSSFPRNDETVWDMNIYAFMDSVKRIQKEMNAKLLYQSGYSGFGISFKDIDKKELDWLGEL